MIACVEALIQRTDEGFELVRDERTMSAFLGCAPARPYFLVLEQWDDLEHIRARGPVSDRSRGLRAPFLDEPPGEA